VDDDWYFERLDADGANRILTTREWPSTFDGWQHVWPQGAEVGPIRVRRDAFQVGGAIDHFQYATARGM